MTLQAQAGEHSEAGSRPAFLFWFAIAVGLCVGAVEAGVMQVQSGLLHRLVFAGRSTLWMAPLADAVLFAAVGLGLACLARLRPGPAAFALGIGMPLFLGALSLLLLVPRIHRVAVLLLAAGFAVQATRLAGTWLLSRTRLPRLAAALLGATVLFAAGFEAWHAASERRAASALATARQGAPNVLLIFLDTVRATELSLYGYDRATTPELSAWARSGLVFERALSAAPWTLVSHATVMTGRWPHELSANWLVPLDATFPTLAERLTAAGYQSAGFVANTEYCSAETGLARGFIHFEDYTPSVAEALLSVSLGRTIIGNRFLRRLVGSEEIVGRKRVGDINRAFLGWLDHAGDHPYFAFLNYYDAHAPYLPPREFADRFGPTEPRQNVRLGLQESWTTEEVQLQRNAYDASIAALDAGLGELFRELERRGQLQNTLVILTADHGEEFHEHGLMGHGNSLYRESVHVPLILALPGRIPGDARRSVPVSLRDIPATVLDLVGMPDSGSLPGRSLARYFASAPDAGETTDSLLSEVRYASGLLPHYPAGHGDMQSLLLDGDRYIHNSGDGREELFDFERDTAEAHDLSALPAGAAKLTRLRDALKVALQPADTGNRP